MMAPDLAFPPPPLRVGVRPRDPAPAMSSLSSLSSLSPRTRCLHILVVHTYPLYTGVLMTTFNISTSLLPRWSIKDGDHIKYGPGDGDYYVVCAPVSPSQGVDFQPGIDDKWHLVTKLNYPGNSYAYFSCAGNSFDSGEELVAWITGFLEGRWGDGVASPTTDATAPPPTSTPSTPS